jgi:HD-GYP domain-containing protein (c-di-GMP phosphodiesterase class II)
MRTRKRAPHRAPATLRVLPPAFPVVAPPASRVTRYLPLAIAVTALVIMLPAGVVAALLPRGGIAMTLVSAIAAVAVSLIVATAAAALWKRQPRSRDVVFADLMLWGWLRRCWTERRLSQARELFESARRAGPLVNIELLLGLNRLLEARDAYIHGHSQRVARHAVRIGRAMNLSEREVAKIATAADVHDVGKMYTPRKILNNPQKLDEWEFAVVKEHAACGAEMVSVVGDPEITAMVRHHHERIDGAGYPDALAGSAIPLGARIIAVADTFDAITSDRPYRAARSQKRALDVLSGEAGAQLDADAVAAFQQNYSARRSVGWYAFGVAATQRGALALQSTISSVGAGGASVASLAPALGAAGLLAVSPGLFRVSRAPHASAGSPALVQPLHAAGEAPSAPGGAPAASYVAVPRARGGIGPAVRIRRSGAPTTSPRGGADTGTRPSGSAVGSSSPENPAPRSRPPIPGRPPLPGPPPIPAPPPVAPVTVPVITVPGVTTPTISTPAITTPGVTTPAGNAPGVTVPSVTVP